jgi:hypothetical protein
MVIQLILLVLGVGKDGLIRHFFHRPSKAYTTGTRKRRKVHTDEQGGETRWHKTGKTRPVFTDGKLKGYKKILVLYTNYGKQRKPEKTTSSTWAPTRRRRTASSSSPRCSTRRSPGSAAVWQRSPPLLPSLQATS